MRWRGGLLAAGCSLLLLTPAMPQADAGVIREAPAEQPLAPPAWQPKEGEVLPQTALARARTCAKKRTDACGCHHYFGVRHCHAKLKTDRCQRRVEVLPQQPDAQERTWLALTQPVH